MELPGFPFLPVPVLTDWSDTVDRQCWLGLPVQNLNVLALRPATRLMDSLNKDWSSKPRSSFVHSYPMLTDCLPCQTSLKLNYESLQGTDHFRNRCPEARPELASWISAHNADRNLYVTDQWPNFASVLSKEHWLVWDWLQSEWLLWMCASYGFSLSHLFPSHYPAQWSFHVRLPSLSHIFTHCQWYTRLPKYRRRKLKLKKVWLNSGNSSAKKCKLSQVNQFIRNSLLVISALCLCIGITLWSLLRVFAYLSESNTTQA